MNSSSRASPPPPLDLRPPSRGRRNSLTSPDSDDSPALLQSQRTVTGSSADTNPESFSPSNRKMSFGWVKASPTVNVHTTCGRHTDQLLFGGPSLRGLARALLGKKKE